MYCMAHGCGFPNPPKRTKGSIDRMGQLVCTLAPKAPEILSVENGQFFSTQQNTRQNDDFSEPPRCTDSKNPICIVC